MKKGIKLTLVGDRIQQRIEEIGISQAELARQVGKSQATINAIIIGRIKKPGDLHLIAAPLNVSVDWLLGVDNKEPPKAIKVLKEVRAKQVNSLSTSSSYSIPIKATAAGDISKGSIVPGKNIGKIVWPPQLRSMEGLYAVYVSGDSMCPAFKNKDLALISPYLPYGEGDIVIFVEKQSEYIGKEMSIKTYIGQERDVTVFEQLNPRSRIEISTKKIQCIHKVLSHREIVS